MTNHVSKERLSWLNQVCALLRENIFLIQFCTFRVRKRSEQLQSNKILWKPCSAFSFKYYLQTIGSILVDRVILKLLKALLPKKLSLVHIKNCNHLEEMLTFFFTNPLSIILLLFYKLMVFRKCYTLCKVLHFSSYFLYFYHNILNSSISRILLLGNSTVLSWYSWKYSFFPATERKKNKITQYHMKREYT